MGKIIIHDDFFPDLELIKNEVLIESDFSYFDNQTYPGERTPCLSVSNPAYYSWFCDKILNLLFDFDGISKIEAKILTYFQKITKFDEEETSILNQGAIHQDTGIFSGIIYLNQHFGTNLYVLKKECYEKIAKQKMIDFESLKVDFYSNKKIDITEYSKKLVEINSLFDVDVQVSNKPNRLFMFPSEYWHGVPSFYGDEPRYTQVFFIKNIKITKKKSEKKISYYGKNHICFAESNFQVAQGG